MKHRLSQCSIRLFKSQLVAIIVLLLLADLTADLASASALNVPNASFESPYVGLGGARVAIDIWSINGMAGVGGNGWSGGQINLLNSDGDQIAWMNTDVNSSVSQLLTETYTVGASYALTVGLARAAWNPPNDNDQIQIQLFYSAAGNPVIASTTVTASELNPSNGNYLVDYTVDVPQVTASDIYAGMQIGIRIVSSFEGTGDGSGDWVFDNVRLDKEQQPIPVNVANDSFETPDLSPDGAQYGIPGWGINGPAAGVAHNGWQGGDINLANSDGEQVGWLNSYADPVNELISSGIWQVLPDTYTVGQSY